MSRQPGTFGTMKVKRATRPILGVLVLFAVTLADDGCKAAAQSLSEQSLSSELDELLDSHECAARTAICLKVVDLEHERLIYDRRGEQLMTPASNLKIYTGACALATFGPHHRFETQIRITGQIERGELHGDIVLVGGGDPMLRSDDLRAIAATLVTKYRLHKIRGSVRVDNSRYRSPLKGPGWMWDDDPFYFNMSITPLMVDFNVLEVQITAPPEGVPIVSLQPQSDWPPIEFQPSESGLAATRRPFEETIRIRGNPPAGESVTHRITMHDPAKWIERLFARMLMELGVTFEASHSDDDRTIVTERSFPGPPLHEIVSHFYETSENAVGEVLLHEIAIAGDVPHPDWNDGASAISKWLVHDAGLAEDSFRLRDGSGLSRYNLIAADSSTRLLSFMHRHEHAERFRASLPTYDVDMSNLTWDSTLALDAGQGRVRAKGGSMSGVSTCSGYLKTLDGRWLAFSYLTNGFIGRSDPQIDLRQQVWQRLIRFRPE